MRNVLSLRSSIKASLLLPVEQMHVHSLFLSSLHYLHNISSWCCLLDAGETQETQENLSVCAIPVIKQQISVDGSAEPESTALERSGDK